jgi:hypothetical protein
VSKVLVRRFSISRGELVGESFRAHAIYGKSEVAVGDGGVSRLNWPQRLAAMSYGFIFIALLGGKIIICSPQAADGGGRVEHQLGTVYAVHEPILGMVPSVANVDGDFAKFGLQSGFSI